MSKAVTNYQTGVKYSFRPLGLRSKLLVAISGFVVAFGGALAVASPADAGGPPPTPTPSVSCFVDVTPTPSPSPSPSASPSPSPSPTPCPTATVTVTVTITKDNTVYVQAPAPTASTVTVTPSPSLTPSQSPTVAPVITGQSSEPAPSMTPVAGNGGSGGWSLWTWAFIILMIAGAVLILLGLLKRRKPGYQGAHAVNNTDTQVIPAYDDSDEDYGVNDYAPSSGFDPKLGGWPGESYAAAHPGQNSPTEHLPTVAPDATVVIPPVTDEPTPGKSEPGR